MSIAIVRQADAKMWPLLKLTHGTFQNYANRHGYYFVDRLREGDSNEGDLMRARWRTLIEYGVHFQADWLLHVDADAVITNPDIRLENLIQRSFNFGKSILFARDDNGLCCGVALVRNNPISRIIFEALTQLGDMHPDVHKQYGGIVAHDQNVFKLLVNNFTFFDGAIHTSRILQDYPRDHTKDSFILHAAQRSMDERIALLKPHAL